MMPIHGLEWPIYSFMPNKSVSLDFIGRNSFSVHQLYVIVFWRVRHAIRMTVCLYKQYSATLGLSRQRIYWVKWKNFLKVKFSVVLPGQANAKASLVLCDRGWGEWERVRRRDPCAAPRVCVLFPANLLCPMLEAEPGAEWALALAPLFFCPQLAAIFFLVLALAWDTHTGSLKAHCPVSDDDQHL